MNTAHGFVWPAGLPGCAMCGSLPEDPIHVTPSRQFAGTMPVHEGQLPRTSHAYVMPSGRVAQVLCLACSRPMSDSLHPIGMPSGRLMARDFSTKEREKLSKEHKARPDGSFPIENAEDLRNAIRLAGQAKDPAAARAHIRRRAKALGLEHMIPDSWGGSQKAFVAEIGDRLIVAGRGVTGDAFLTGNMVEFLRERSSTESAHMWVSGRYVEADVPNRNAAYWSTEDLELGEPTVAHGPVNWLHEERHIIGSIAATEMVRPGLQLAVEGEPVGNHIVALAAVWPWLYPQEARMIRDSSEAGSLWFSMECISRAVACRADDCGHEMQYASYMREKDQRCDHMKDGQPRRFIDPIFEGAGIIVPPVRPGWVKAEARVLMPQAAVLAERQAAAFEGMETSDAELLVATLMASVEE